MTETRTAVVCTCDGMHARGNTAASCIYFEDGTLRPEARSHVESAAPRVSASQRRKDADRMSSYSNAVRNYNHR